MGFDEALKIREELCVVGFARHLLDLLLHVGLDRLASRAGSTSDDLVGVLGDISYLDGGHPRMVALQRCFACVLHMMIGCSVRGWDAGVLRVLCQRLGCRGVAGAHIVQVAMRPSFVRYLALGVLALGLAAIAWTALRGDDPGGDSAATLGSAGSGAADSGSAGSGDAASGGDADSGDAAAGRTDGSTAATTVPSSGTESGAGAVDDSASAATTTVAATTVPPEPIEVLGEADTLTGLDGWLNTDATSLEEIRAANTLTVVQFWTFGCRNCKNTLEALGRLYADFRHEGVEIVGVHSPEFSYEADVGNIIEAAADLGVVWPIALDTNKRNFHRWQEGNIGYWPRVYVIDGDNQVRFDRTGDGRATYAQLYQTVERLLTDA